METTYFLGIDLAKKTFQAALTIDGTHMHETTVENSAPAIEEFFLELKTQFSLSFTQLIVGLEHTGIYGLPLLDYLAKSKVRVCVESPLQIKQSQGMKRGKSDKVDARRIAQYVHKNRQELRFWKPQRYVIQKLKALLVVRERMVKAKRQFEVPLNESTEFIDPSIQKLTVKSCRSTLTGLKGDIKNIDREIDLLIKADTQLSNQMKLATSVPGIGKITAAHVIVHTDEFVRINDAKKFACYSGVAPFEHSSGISIRGKTRVSKLANMTLKRLLHLAAMSAIQCCEELSLFYLRKIGQGKNKMSVINAVRNKLIARVFSCINNNREYQKIYQNALA